jgi:hypothetical protein
VNYDDSSNFSENFMQENNLPQLTQRIGISLKDLVFEETIQNSEEYSPDDLVEELINELDGNGDEEERIDSDAKNTPSALTYSEAKSLILSLLKFSREKSLISLETRLMEGELDLNTPGLKQSTMDSFLIRPPS